MTNPKILVNPVFNTYQGRDDGAVWVSRSKMDVRALLSAARRGGARSTQCRRSKVFDALRFKFSDEGEMVEREKKESCLNRPGGYSII